MKIKITADSTCDLPKDLLDQWNVALIPLTVIVGDESYYDGKEIAPADIFHFVEEGKNCSTAAINLVEYNGFFKEQIKGYDGLVHISISSHLSSSYDNAVLAAKSFPDIQVVDSLNLSTGIGLLVKDAVALAEKGLTPKEIVQALEKDRDLYESTFVVSSIDYLRRGGRCSALEATGAKVLRIKPSIEVDNGKMHPGKKYRGTFAQCVKNYVNDRLQGRDDVDVDTIFLTHCQCQPELVEEVRKAIQSLDVFKHIHIAHAGCTIACHCGPQALGVMLKKKR